MASLLASIRRFLTLSCKHGRWHVRIKTFSGIKHKNKDPSWWARVTMGPGVLDVDLSKGRPGTWTQGAWCLTQDPFIWTTRLNLNLKHKEQKFVLGMWKLSGMGGRGRWGPWLLEKEPMAYEDFSFTGSWEPWSQHKLAELSRQICGFGGIISTVFL